MSVLIISYFGDTGSISTTSEALNSSIAFDGLNRKIPDQHNGMGIHKQWCINKEMPRNSSIGPLLD